MYMYLPALGVAVIGLGERGIVSDLHAAADVDRFESDLASDRPQHMSTVRTTPMQNTALTDIGEVSEEAEEKITNTNKHVEHALDKAVFLEATESAERPRSESTSSERARQSHRRKSHRERPKENGDILRPGTEAEHQSVQKNTTLTGETRVEQGGPGRPTLFLSNPTTPAAEHAHRIFSEYSKYDRIDKGCFENKGVQRCVADEFCWPAVISEVETARSGQQHIVVQTNNVSGFSCRAAARVYHVPTERPLIPDYPDTKVLLLSDGLSNHDLKFAFRSLVQQLPAEVWDSDLNKQFDALYEEAQRPVDTFRCHEEYERCRERGKQLEHNERVSKLKRMLLTEYQKHAFGANQEFRTFTEDMVVSILAETQRFFDSLIAGSFFPEAMEGYWSRLRQATSHNTFLHGVRLFLAYLNIGTDLARRNFWEPFLYQGLTAMALNPGAFFKKKRAEFMRDKGVRGLQECCKKGEEEQLCCKAFHRKEPVLPPDTKSEDFDKIAHPWDDLLLLPAETFEGQLKEMGFPMENYHEVKLFGEGRRDPQSWHRLMEELLEIYLLDHPVDTPVFPQTVKWLESTNNLVTSPPKPGRKFSYEHLKSLKERLDEDIKAHASEDLHNMWTSTKTGESLKITAEIFIIGGGDPDVINFALHFHKAFFDELVAMVRKGRSIFMGRSGGAMAAGLDMGISREFMPNWHHLITKGRMAGLGLVDAMVRPHYNFQRWDAVVVAYSVLKGESILRLPNGEGIICRRMLASVESIISPMEIASLANDCTAIGNADPAWRQNFPPPDVLTRYYGLGEAKAWSEIADVVSPRWGNKRLGEVLGIRPHRQGFSLPTAHPSLLMDQKSDIQGYSGRGCFSKVLNELPWAQQCTWMKNHVLLPPQELRADRIECPHMTSVSRNSTPVRPAPVLF